MSHQRTGSTNPATRRPRLTILSGALISLALVARSASAPTSMWAALMIMATLVAGSDIATSAWGALRVRHLGIELLVTIAAAGALAIGEFWEAAAVTFLFMFGAWLEARTMRRTRGALTALVRAAPPVAVVLRDNEVVEVATHLVRNGETVLVKPGQKIPVDGEIVDGAAAVDESTITGESIPKDKRAGDHVFAGTITHNGMLRIRATGVGADTTLARIIRRVEEAQEEKAPTQLTIERFARWYTPAIVALAVIAFVVTFDVRLALTLLVIGCPGALVISTPVSIVAGIGRAARAGILIKGGQHLESAGKITVLAVDKTGTLTEGKPRLVEILTLSMSVAGKTVGEDDFGWEPNTPTSEAGAILLHTSEREVLRWAAIAESGSTHPLGSAVVQAALVHDAVPAPDELLEYAGAGVSARYEGRDIAVGSRRLMSNLGITIGSEVEARLAELRGRGHTPVLVALDGEITGILGLADSVRPSALQMVRRLRDVGIEQVVMLTGDDRNAARGIAGATGITEVHAELLPEQKLEHIQRLQRMRSGNGRTNHVAMLGDGINDAPALAAADISIAMGVAGSDLAIETADIALLSDDLGKITEAISISRATLRNMRQNLAIALITVVGLLTGVLSGDVHMAGGMLIHQLSVLAVIANGMRLMKM